MTGSILHSETTTYTSEIKVILKTMVLSQGKFCMPEEIFSKSRGILGCHNWRWSCHWHPVDRATDTAKHPIMYRTAVKNKKRGREKMGPKHQ